MNKVIDGVGREVAVEVNSNGGKQSSTPYAVHLIDPDFLMRMYEDNHDEVIFDIATFMKVSDKEYLLRAIDDLKLSETKAQTILRIAKVLKEGVQKYRANNWRLIPQEEHLNHAIIHYLAWTTGDTQDDHLDHFLCRIMMAYATQKSEHFYYNKYADEAEENHE